MEKTIETRVAETILQQKKKIAVGDEIYEVAPPSLATLILASEAISMIPGNVPSDIRRSVLDNVKLNPDVEVRETLCMAKDYRILGDIIAILILGAKNLKGTRKITKKRFGGIIKEERVEVVDNKAILSEKILHELSPEQVNDLLSELLNHLRTGFFLSTSIFLTEINIIQKTRKKEKTGKTRTTVFGRQ
jgi:hypothetical protein